MSKRTEEPKEPRNRTSTVPEPNRILEPWYGSWFLKFQIFGSRDGSGRKRRRLTKNGEFVNNNVVDIGFSDDDKFAHLDETKTFGDDSQKIGKVVWSIFNHQYFCFWYKFQN